MGYRLPHAEAQPPKLDAERVPPEFRRLIPLAEKYGVSDDGYRSEMLESLDDEERNELATFLAEYDDALDAWLAGPEADNSTPTNEYITFSCLRIAADEAGT
ncbi:MAG: hypothetical protein ACI92S_003144 [Planctomycetaceae bacterium]|jgi:hypothetical protein